MAKIRHLAFFADSPEEMAKFYVNAFGFEITGRGIASVWLTDGYLDIALLKRADNMHVHTGLNHFGITLDADEQPGVYERLNKMGHTPFKPPSDRSYVEDYCMDVERNKFDLSTSGRESRQEPEDGLQGAGESLIRRFRTAGDGRPCLAPNNRRMRFVIFFSMAFWVALTIVSTVDLGATAKLFATIHLG